MRINHNISALKATSLLNRNNSAMEKNIEKLSSGYKINRAADDGAGMAISKKMRLQIRALDQASQNSADGISVIQTAEGALNEVTSMLQRMRELSVQAANGSYTLSDRETIQKEIDQLNSEIQRVSESTEFNTKTLLDGSLDRKTYTNNASVEVSYTSDAVKAGAYSVKVNQAPEKAAVVGGTLTNTATNISATEAGVITINGEQITINEGDTMTEVYERIRLAGDSMGIDVYPTDGTSKTSLADGAKLKFETKQYGSSESVSITTENAALAAKLGLSTTNSAAGKDVKLTLNSPLDDTATVKTDGGIATITDLNGVEIQLQVKSDVGTGTVNFNVLDAGSLVLQVGAANKQTLEINLPRVDCATLGLENLNVCTEKSATKSINKIDDAISKVTDIRAKLGAYQNRLDHAVNNLDTVSLNLDEALSRITDTDMAKEMTKYTQNQVLVQAGSSVLAQANELPQTVLSLLQG
ncbi:flagellin protein FlaA [Lachnospiraceae bacterium KM106-2]|nr:flagellin protein FlaA [Lachnospiraceae bacterium KM106-2]